MKMCGLKFGIGCKLFSVLKIFRFMIVPQTVLLHKVPHLPTPKEKNKVDSHFDWENELLYGPLIKRKDEDHKVTSQDINNVNQSQNVYTKNSEGNKSLGTNAEVTDCHVNEPSAPSQVLTIPFGNQPTFPIKTATKNDECLRVAAKQLIGFSDPTFSSFAQTSASVTSILQQTMPPESVAILERWRKQMIAKLGVEGFAKYQEDTFQTGAALHKSIHNFLKGQPTPNSEMDSRILGHWKSIMSVLQEISDIVMLETKISHPYLRYHGIADCVAKHRNKLVLIEWKTSQKPKPLLRHTYDNPLQVAAYMGAFNADSSEHTQVDSGVIVVCYPDGTPSHTHIMDPLTSQKAWESWLLRLQQFWTFQKHARKGASES